MALNSGDVTTPPTPTLPAPSLTDALLPLVAPVAQQAVAAATADLSSRLSTVESQLATVLTTAAPQLVVAGESVLANVEKDATTQRLVVTLVLGAALAGALIVLCLYLAGNTYAGKIIAGVPVVAGTAVALIARLDGLPTSKPAATTLA